jgi:endonuclease YncB( thermonuclease family)
MPFTLIKGRFKPLTGIPDGDSVRFLANDLKLWRRLEGKLPEIGQGAKNKGTVQLRFEGIDAIEKRAIKPLSTEARDHMLRLIGFDRRTNPEPVGYILARMTDDASGRPIAFVFAGTTSKKDGSSVLLDRAWLRQSVNVKQAEAGFAYPLYYNTLFATLREEINQAMARARKNKVGYWPLDRTVTGVTVTGYQDLAAIPPIWPKLWRRLEEFLRRNTSLRGFMDFLERRNERVDILPFMEERGLHDLVEVQGDTVRLTERPEHIRVIGKAGRRCRCG